MEQKSRLRPTPDKTAFAALKNLIPYVRDQIFLRFAHWSCYRELAKAGPVLSGVFTNRAFLHIRSWFSFLIFHKRLLDPRGEVAQTGSSQWREWDKAWNSAKGACLLWLEFRSYHRAGGPIVWASLFATFLAMKKVEEIFY